jgi:folate-dependent phosphoribosylglycinamide formyltransferase PurN
MLRLGWFSTGRGPGSRRLLATVGDEIAAKRLDAGIEVVFCNREPGQDAQTDQLLEQVRGYGLPLVYLSSLRFRQQRGERPARPGEPLPEWRRDFDREVIRLLEPYPFDLGVLAGYMLIGSDVLCDRFDLLNLHPAAPDGPTGTWQEVIWQLIEQRADHSGVRMHLATRELDMGPPVTCCVYSLRGPAFDPSWREVEGRGAAAVRSEEGEENALFQEIRRQGLARELPLVVETLRAFTGGRVRIEGRRVVEAGGREVAGYDLTEQIERIVAQTKGQSA